MSKPNALLRAVLAVAAMAGVAPAARAQAVSGCSATADLMYFGLIMGVGANTDSTATIRLQCDPRITVAVGIDRGMHSNGINRIMVDPATGQELRYEIYMDAARTVRWTDQRNEKKALTTNALGAASAIAYGRIPSSTISLPDGVFSDVVTVVIEF